MNLKLFIVIFLCIVSINTYSQEVIQESKQMTAEQKRIQAVEDEIRKIEAEYRKAEMQYGKSKDYIVPKSFSLGAKEPVLNKKIQEIERALYSIQESGLLELGQRINQLRKTINKKYDYSHSIERTVNSLNADIKSIRKELASRGIKEIENKNKAEKLSLDRQIESDKLDSQISDLDKLLGESSNESANKGKSKSLDDYLFESGKSSGTSSKDYLADAGKKSTTSNDIFSENDNESNSNNSDVFGGTNNGESGKIDSKNGMQGVKSSSGKVLIPYKNWQIVKFKMGIAKVRERMDSYSTDCGLAIAYKVGFVDKSGGYIDRFSVEIERNFSSGSNGLYLISSSKPGGLTDADRKRIEQSRRKKAEIKIKKCRLESKSWENRMLNKYN